jgi:hypothetical protein
VGHDFIIDPGHNGTRREFISLGMKVLWSMLTTGLAPAFCGSSARPGVDARTMNRTLKARRTPCGWQLHSPSEVTLFAVKRMESRTIKTNLLVSVQVEAICRGRIDGPPFGVAAPLTEDSRSRDEIPSSNTFLIIETSSQQKRSPNFGRKAGARCCIRRLVSVRNDLNAA